MPELGHKINIILDGQNEYCRHCDVTEGCMTHGDGYWVPRVSHKNDDRFLSLTASSFLYLMCVAFFIIIIIYSDVKAALIEHNVQSYDGVRGWWSCRLCAAVFTWASAWRIPGKWCLRRRWWSPCRPVRSCRRRRWNNRCASGDPRTR